MIYRDAAKDIIADALMDLDKEGIFNGTQQDESTYTGEAVRIIVLLRRGGYEIVKEGRR